MTIQYIYKMNFEIRHNSLIKLPLCLLQSASPEISHFIEFQQKQLKTYCTVCYTFNSTIIDLL